MKSGARRVWLITTSIVLVLLIVINIAAFVFYELLNIVMPGGGERPAFSQGIDAVYQSDYHSKEEALEAANAMNLRLCEEGMVLLKNENNALPLLTPKSDSTVTEQPRISIFGKNSVDLAYGGSGSGGVNAEGAVDLYTALERAGYALNPELKAFYEDEGSSGPARAANSSDLDSGKSIRIATGETPQSRYTDKVKSSYSSYSDAALVVFTRIGGEGFDLPRQMDGAEGAASPNDHYLQLDQNERDLLSAVCNAGFQRVIVAINSGAAMELTFLTDPGYFSDAGKIDAAVWMGFPGASGTEALGEILNGSVDPSGRTVDTYASDLKAAPSFQNFGDNCDENGDRYYLDGKPQNYYFVDYEEGIYVGYKYYETRGCKDEQWYQENVVYPFGYGLSYTQFAWEVTEQSSIRDQAISADGSYQVTVKVTNTGSRPGKDVVQLYAHAPYFDGGIEKPHVVLVGFAKTGLLAPNESESVTIPFSPYALASYDYNDANQNGFKGYELEAGDGYALMVARNAHTYEETIPFKVDGGIRFQTDEVTGTPVENRYTDCANPYLDSDYMLGATLSRSDWAGTFPTSPSAADREVESGLISALSDTKHNNPEDLDSVDMPWFDEASDIVLRDMLQGQPAAADYEDERWQAVLEKCSANELINMISYGAFNSAAIESIGKPKTNDTDGPVGFVNFMDSTTYYGACSYCCEVVIASTWNEELVEEFGRSVGEEGIWGDAEGRSNGMPYSGWYAPGANIHRSPFGGRNFEYYSEDGFLSGKMAAAQIRGCQSKGVYCFMKHFALNEQETHRSLTGDITWVTEQAMREIYLKPFEIAVKEGGTRAIMSSFTRIGTRWTGGDYRLLTSILRDEWGFRGTVICDFNTGAVYMDQKQMAYAGGDLNLSTTPKSWCDVSDAADAFILARCAKNILYTVVNSNAMNHQVDHYGMPIWTRVLIAVDAAAVLGLAAWGVAVFRKKKTV